MVVILEIPISKFVKEQEVREVSEEGKKWRRGWQKEEEEKW